MTDTMTDTDTLEGVEYKTTAFGSDTPWAYLKADQSGKTRDFSAIVSVFDIPDMSRDIVRMGAFKRTLEEFKQRGRTIPVVWNHQYGNPESYVGVVTEAKELAPGDPLLPDDIKAHGALWVAGTIDDDDTRANKVYSLLKGGRVSEFSFGYTIAKYAMLESDDGGRKFRELQDLDLWEVGPTIRGLHPKAGLTGIKARPTGGDTPAQSAPVNLTLHKARLRLLAL